MSSNKLAIVYTDGGSRGESGTCLGAWAYVVLERTADGLQEERRASKAEYQTTNNRMELTAVIEALKSMEPGSRVRIFSDSEYVVRGFNDPSYLKKWINNGWKNSKKEPVANADLWIIMHEVAKGYDLTLAHIYGHGKNHNDEHDHWNDQVDKMCTEAIRTMMDAEHTLNSLLSAD